MSKIILFYKFVTVENPNDIMLWQKELCQSLQLKGRVLIAHHGINATLGGSIEEVEEYKKEMQNHPLFADIDFKESPGGAESFPRLRVAVRKSVINMGIDYDAAYVADCGTHLTPAQTHEMITNKSDDLVILDARNNYEAAIGKFEDAITPDIKNFRDFPAYVDAHLDAFKDKKVLMYCTGGIRCEPASAYLKQQGIAKEVYQILGGIHRYTEEYPDGFFRGKNYVFDGRVAMPITQEVLSRCEYCPTVCDEYRNCMNADCNKLFICCDECIANLKNTCSAVCKELLADNKVAPRPQFKKTPISSFCSL
jgi:predicted sulfurtransferase